MDTIITYRLATRDDAADLQRLTRGLAATMDRVEDVTATAEDLARRMFDEGAGGALVAEHASDGVVGCAIFFRTFSTWDGKSNLYLEDLFVEEAYRGEGVGRALMCRLAALCEERGCGKLSWHCRDTNPSGLAFYEHLGATRVDALIVHRLEGDALAARAKEVRS